MAATGAIAASLLPLALLDIWTPTPTFLRAPSSFAVLQQAAPLSVILRQNIQIAGFSNIDVKGHAISSLVVTAIWVGTLILNAFGTFGELAGACYSAALPVMLLETIHSIWVTFRVTQEES